MYDEYNLTMVAYNGGYMLEFEFADGFLFWKYEANATLESVEAAAICAARNWYACKY